MHRGRPPSDVEPRLGGVTFPIETPVSSRGSPGRTSTSSASAASHPAVRDRRPLLGFQGPARMARRGPGDRSAALRHRRLLLDNCIVVIGVLYLSTYQENKGTRWMPWHLEPMKDVDGCDKPRGAAEQALIRGFPNGETHPW